MADQVGSGTVPGAMSESSGLEPQDQSGALEQGPTAPAAHEAFHGRTVSWVAVSIMLVGFIIGGVGLIAGPTWWLVWAGGAVVVVGGILALATGIFNDWY
jgi:hypothetical protein